MLTLTQIADITFELNQELLTITANDDIMVSMISDGSNITLKFLGITIWELCDDKRIEIYEDILEPFEPFIREEINYIIRSLIGIQL